MIHDSTDYRMVAVSIEQISQLGADVAVERERVLKLIDFYTDQIDNSHWSKRQVLDLLWEEVKSGKVRN